MHGRTKKRARGFSLLEMTIAIALGTLVLGAAVQLYSQGVAATFTVSQRAEMQQNFRAASNLITKDMSLAGAGMGNGVAIALPSGTTPVIGCDSTACHLGIANATAQNYPLQGTTPYLYGLIPGYNAGPTVTTPPGRTDAVTVAYTDTTFYLNCYKATVTNTTTVTFSVPSPLTCTLPSGVSTPQAINDSVVGLTPGDVLMFSFGSQVLAEVTSVSGSVVTFATADPLKFNQPTVANSLGANNGAVGTATRLLIITYYVDQTVNPALLMRQVSGHSPTPVGDGIIYMKFSFDMYNSASNTIAVNQCNPGTNDSCNFLNGSSGSAGLLPNQITKINILHMAIDSALHGTKGFQGLDLETSVSARDLTYNNNYPLPPS